MIQYKMLPDVINEMEKFYAELQKLNGNKSDKESLVDEKIGNELALVYSQLMCELYNETSKGFCEGCLHDYPSQRHHDCIMMPLEERIDFLF